LGTDLFSTMRILAPLPEKTRAGALGQFFRQTLHCGDMVPEKITKAPFATSLPARREGGHLS